MASRCFLICVLIVCTMSAYPRSAGAGDLAPCPASLADGIPHRAASQATGSDFARRISGMAESEREAAIGKEFLAGNVPQFLRRPVAVRLSPSSNTVAATVCVLPDYLAVGSDDDFFLTPMRLETALMVARSYGFTLPTQRIVDAVYEQSAVHLEPHPLPPSDQMRTTAYYWQHNEIIRAQRVELGAPLGILTAGHKKDLVLTGQLQREYNKIAIYGWHRDVGSPIQPLSTVHGAHYADYSHGVRLVSTSIYVGGQQKPIDEILEDPRTAGVLSDEGAIPQVERLIDMLSSYDARTGQLAAVY